MRKHSAKQARARDETHSKKHAAGGGGSTFVGILIGLVLGLAIALGVAWYISKLPNPFKERPQAPQPQKAESPAPKGGLPVEPLKDTKAKAADSTTASGDKSKLSAQEMLTKGERASGAADKAAEAVTTPAAKEAFFLQAGSFQNAPDADNLKARLALLGFEAAIQTRTLPEKGVWHRVRVGPYADVEELNRVRGVLKQNNIETTLVKVREADK